MKKSYSFIAFLIIVASCADRPLTPSMSAYKGVKDNGDSDLSKDPKADPSQDESDDTQVTPPVDDKTGMESPDKPIETPETPEPMPEPVPDPVPEPVPEKKPVSIKALTFNVYTATAAEIAKSVKSVNPDLACLQEASVNETKDTAKLLGEGWVAVVPPDGSEYSFVARLPLVKSLGNTSVKRGVVGAIFRIGEVEAAFFCHHGDYPAFGARDYFVKKISAEAAIANEKKYREGPMKAVLAFVEPYKKKGMPVFIMGDFNTASHTDYINPQIPWPITMMIDSAGYSDSWRELHQDLPRKAIGQYLKTDPGITWYRLKREPQDIYTRMDYIFHAGPAKAKESNTVDLAPSDHFSLFTIFEVEQ